jgi:hypothetical protein
MVADVHVTSLDFQISSISLTKIDGTRNATTA